MGKAIGIGHQDFETIRQEDCFYIDKTLFVKEWWERKDVVTLITRPRRFGKTLTMSMVDEYDAPMQEAYVNGFWEELVSFTRSMFNATFKTNPYLERAIMTGVTRISKESIFLDLNNPEVVTTTSEKNADCFGFTEFKVFRPKREKKLEDTVKAALEQIEEKKYDRSLIAKGIPKERIRKLGFAFCGKKVLIGEP